ncbi:MAG: folylpolyglutamate synthase/dihydrofolate synthase family protein [Bacillota bacterium]
MPVGKASASEALEYLGHLARFGMRLGLERMEAILERLGHPERRFGVVHVAGTNGKGSTAAMVAAAAGEAGVRTGLYTSPHLVRFNERIVVDKAPVTDEVLADAYRAVRAAVEEMAVGEAPTQFEFATAMAFWAFARARVELAVVEVGLGGRLDATNVVRPEVCVITPLGLDHTEVLGDTLAAIAGEKAGIIKPGADVVTPVQPDEAAAVIRSRAASVGAALFEVVGPPLSEGPAMDVPLPAGSESVYRFTPRRADVRGGLLDLVTPEGERIADLEVGLLGLHQLQNAAVAAAALHRLRARGWPITEQGLRTGLRQVVWPGRLQVVGRRPWVVIDGAHNPAAAGMLADSFRTLFGGLPRVLVVGMLKEKDVQGVLRALVAPGATVIATRARSSRTEPASPEELAAVALALGAGRAEAVVPAADALRRALELATPDDTVAVAGSLYLAGELLADLKVDVTARNVLPPG